MIADNARDRSSVSAMVRAFYETHSLPIRTKPTSSIGAAEVEQMRDVLSEEVAELEGAMAQQNLVKVADGLADVVYVAYGIALQYGIDLDQVIDAVHDSNMTKNRDGDMTDLDNAGKVPRGSGYVPPAIDELLRRSVGEGE